MFKNDTIVIHTAMYTAKSWPFLNYQTELKYMYYRKYLQEDINFTISIFFYKMVCVIISPCPFLLIMQRTLVSLFDNYMHCIYGHDSKVFWSN